jgi:hypothetical protein
VLRRDAGRHLAVCWERHAVAREPFVATRAWEAFLAFARQPVDDVDASRDGDLLVLQADRGRGSEAVRARLGITLERIWTVSFSRQLFDDEGDLREIRVDVLFALTPALDALEPQWPLFGVGGPERTDDWATEVREQPAFRTPFDGGQAVGAMVTGAKPHLV